MSTGSPDRARLPMTANTLNQPAAQPPAHGEVRVALAGGPTRSERKAARQKPSAGSPQGDTLDHNNTFPEEAAKGHRASILQKNQDGNMQTQLHECT